MRNKVNLCNSLICALFYTFNQRFWFYFIVTLPKYEHKDLDTTQQPSHTSSTELSVLFLTCKSLKSEVSLEWSAPVINEAPLSPDETVTLYLWQ